jgi:hypothetical protein
MGLMPGSSNPSLIAQGSVSSNNTTTTNNNDNNNHGMRWADNFDMATVLQLVANIKYQELLRAAHQKREDASTAERQLQQNLRAKKQHHAANPKPRAKKGTNKLDHDGRQEGLAAAASETQHPGNDQSIFATNKMQLSEPHLRLVWCLKRSKAATAAAAAFVSFFGVGPTASAGPADSVETTVPLTSTMVSNKAAGHALALLLAAVVLPCVDAAPRHRGSVLALGERGNVTAPHNFNVTSSSNFTASIPSWPVELVSHPVVSGLAMVAAAVGLGCLCCKAIRDKSAAPPPLPGRDDGGAIVALADPRIALVISHYLEAEADEAKLDITLLAAMDAGLPPGKIFVAYNGALTDDPPDMAEGNNRIVNLCARRGVRCHWTNKRSKPEALKNTVENATTANGATLLQDPSIEWVMEIDNDVRLPPLYALRLPMNWLSKSSDVPMSKSMGAVVMLAPSVCAEPSTEFSWWTPLSSFCSTMQNMSLNNASVFKTAQSNGGTTLWPHGAACVCRKDVYAYCLRRCSGEFHGEDKEKGHIISSELGGIIRYLPLPIPTTCPDHVWCCCSGMQALRTKCGIPWPCAISLALSGLYCHCVEKSYCMQQIVSWNAAKYRTLSWDVRVLFSTSSSVGWFSRLTSLHSIWDAFMGPMRILLAVALIVQPDNGTLVVLGQQAAAFSMARTVLTVLAHLRCLTSEELHHTCRGSLVKLVWFAFLHSTVWASLDALFMSAGFVFNVCVLTANTLDVTPLSDQESGISRGDAEDDAKLTHVFDTFAFAAIACAVVAASYLASVSHDLWLIVGVATLVAMACCCCCLQDRRHDRTKKVLWYAAHWSALGVVVYFFEPIANWSLHVSTRGFEPGSLVFMVGTFEVIISALSIFLCGKHPTFPITPNDPIHQARVVHGQNGQQYGSFERRRHAADAGGSSGSLQAGFLSD